ncbi:MAG TPA: glycoside hydrolase family 3 N-terminal domain-containing protein [Terriglobales bacterium]
MRGAFVIIFLFFVVGAFAKTKPAVAAPVHVDREGEKWAEKTLRKLSLEEKIGQLFMMRVRVEFLNDQNPSYVELRNAVEDYHLGSLIMTVPLEGLFLYRNQPLEAANLLNRLQQDSPLPLIIAADFEDGLAMRLHGTTEFPQAMAFGASGKVEYAEAMGRVVAEEARAIGVQWNFAPVADVNSNPENPIINVRSFGEDPVQVGDMAAAYIRGARAAGLLTTAKHFPGHGDTATDSHLGLAEVTGDLAHLESVELPPFRKAIDAGVDAVMVANVTIPALDPSPNHVASTSPSIITELLKKKLGFKGIVVPDGLDMAGLTRIYGPPAGQAAVDAFKAGCDLLILPADLDASYKAMLAAAQSGEISQARIDTSVLKILKAKTSVGLNKKRLVDLADVPTTVGKPENLALGQQISDDAVTLVRDNGKLLPLKRTGTPSGVLPYQKPAEVKNHLLAVIFTDDTRLEAGRTFENQLRERVPDVNVIYVDPRIANAISSEVIAAVDRADAVVAGVFLTPLGGKTVITANGLANSVGLPEPTAKLLQGILDRAAAKTVVAALGSPYVAKDFPAVQNYLCTFSGVSVSEISAVKALFGEIAIHGHSPVSIPGIAQRGAGIERPRIIAQGGSHASAQTAGH